MLDKELNVTDMMVTFSEDILNVDGNKHRTEILMMVDHQSKYLKLYRQFREERKVLKVLKYTAAGEPVLVLRVPCEDCIMVDSTK